MSTRYARRCQAAYLGWCHIHGLKAASTKNLYWYAAQQPAEVQRALLAVNIWERGMARDKYEAEEGHPLEYYQQEYKKDHPKLKDDSGYWPMVANRKQAWSGWGPAVFPKTRQVTGWKWDNHLDGYTSNSPQKFACECGTAFPTPSGFQRCACGKQWNSYVIGTGGTNREAAAEKFLVREIPVRTEGNVIVAGRDEDFRNEKFDEPEEAQYKQHVIDQYNPKEGRRTACWPGCHENEAHAKKFHKDKKEAVVRLVDPRTGKVHSLVDPGEIDDKDGDEAHHNKTKVKKPPKDWAHRGDGAKWRKRTFGEG